MASTWLLLDIAYCSQKLFQKDIFRAVGWISAARSMSALDELFHIGHTKVDQYDVARRATTSQRCWEGGRHRRVIRPFRFLYPAQSLNPAKAAHGFPRSIGGAASCSCSPMSHPEISNFRM
jgi:hypothetical protein